MIRSFEGIRGMAALLVALYHLNIGTAHIPVIRHGYLFVDLFFVLSGFIMAAAYETKLSTGSELRPFLIRRIGRLYPLFIFSTIVFVLAANAIVLAKKIAFENGYASLLNNPNSLDYVIPTVAEVLATVTMTHSMGLFDRLILNTPTWSISVEFYTYFLFAALCLLLKQKARMIAFVILSIAGLTISVWASTTIHDCLQIKGCLSITNDFGFVRCVHAFCLGALAYHANRLARPYSTVLQVAAVSVLALLFLALDTAPGLAFLFPVVFTILILSICGDSGLLARLFQMKPFQMLGERSYSIYLMHMPLVLFFENAAKRATGVLPNTLILVLFMAALIIVSGWTYRFIENPFRKMFNGIADGSRKLQAQQTN